MPISIELALYLLGAAVCAAYFTLFVRTLQSLPDDERARWVAGGPSRLSWLSVLPLVAVFFVEGFYPRLSLAALSLAWTCWASRRQYTRWLEQGFDPGFVARLRRVDVLSLIGVLLVFGGAIAEVWSSR